MQSSVPTLSCLAESNLNMCLQKWFQRKMWNYDKVNNSRCWICCISSTLIKCESQFILIFSEHITSKKIMLCCLTGTKSYIQVLVIYVICCTKGTNRYASSCTTMHMQTWQMVFVLISITIHIYKLHPLPPAGSDSTYMFASSLWFCTKSSSFSQQV